jgi:hypothetical protein
LLNRGAMRTGLLALSFFALLGAGCTAGHAGGTPRRGGGPDPGPDPDLPWSLSIDTDASDRYLLSDEANATIRGVLTASAGADRVEVDGSAAPLDARGNFTAAVPVPLGLSHVEVVGHDTEDRSIHGDRDILRAAYREEGTLNDGAIAIALTDELLAGLGARAGSALDGLDLSTFITPGTPLLSDGRCNIIADSVSHSAPTLALSRTDDGRLRAVATVSDIAVGFHGRCSLLGTNIDIRDGSEADQTTVELSMILAPNAAAPGECSVGLSAEDTSLAITSFDLDLRLGGCGLLCLAGELVGEIAEGTVRGMLQDRMGAMIDGVIGPALSDIAILNTTSTMSFLETPVDLGLCLVGLDSEPSPAGPALVARLGARASAAMPRYGDDAPGAPVLPTTRGELPAGTLAVDPGLLGQILFGAWRGGALSLDSLGAGSGSGGLSLTVDLLTGPVPALRPLIGDEIERGAPLALAIEGAMAPLSRAPTPVEAAMGVDLFLELGNLRIRIGAGEGAARRELFVVSSTVRLALALVPDATGALVPTLVEGATSTTTFLESTTVPGVTGRMGESLAGLVDGLIAAQIAPLLEGAAIALPDLGTPLVVSDVTVDPGGYLLLTLAP